MTGSRLAAYLFGSALSLAACGGGDAPPSDASVQADLGPDAGPVDRRFARIAAAVRGDIESNNATAASVAVWLDGEIVWVGGFGRIAPDGRAPGEHTLFMIGSDTKKIAAMSLLRRVAAGDATFDTKVSEILPTLEMARAPEFTESTIRELLSHRSGIMDGVEDTRTTTDEKLRAYAFGTFASTYVSLAPHGVFWNYSNPGFSIAGLLDEQLSGRPWADVVRDEVFVPLGMTRTVARKVDVDEDHAIGVGLDRQSDTSIAEVSFDDTWEAAFTRPAGLVWSTPSDQMRLAEFLVEGDDDVLPDALREEMTNAQTPLYPDLPGDYGFGLFLGRGLSLGTDWYDVEVWRHGGNTLTHTSTFYVLPEQRFAISILSNGFQDDFSESVATAIDALVDLPSPVARPEPPFDASSLDALVGTYVDERNVGELMISREGDSLRVDAPELDEAGVPYDHALTSQSTRVWLMRVQGTVLDFAFIDGPNGETYMRNRNLVAVRAAASARRPSPRPSFEYVPRSFRPVERFPTVTLPRPR